LTVSEKEGRLNFNILSPEDWSFAKITVTNSENHKLSTTAFTKNSEMVLPVYQNGEYWIEAKIKNENNTYDAYYVLSVANATNPIALDGLNLPLRQIAIILVVVAIIGVIGIRYSKSRF